MQLKRFHPPQLPDAAILPATSFLRKRFWCCVSSRFNLETQLCLAVSVVFGGFPLFGRVFMRVTLLPYV